MTFLRNIQTKRYGEKVKKIKKNTNKWNKNFKKNENDQKNKNNNNQPDIYPIMLCSFY